MKIDLTEVLAVDQYDWQTNGTLNLEAISYARGTFPIVEKTPVKLSVHHAQKGELQVTVDVSLQVEIPCDRCLRTVSYPFIVHAVQPIDLSEEDQPSYVEGTSLDVDELVLHELLLHWPAKVLCREDCRGICPVCGADLNESPCGCDRQVVDPRMAVIQDIFNKFQSN